MSQMVHFSAICVGKRRLSGPLRLSLLSTTKSEGNKEPTLIIQERQKMEITKSLIQVRDNSKNCCCYFAQKKQFFKRTSTEQNVTQN